MADMKKVYHDLTIIKMSQVKKTDVHHGCPFSCQNEISKNKPFLKSTLDLVASSRKRQG